MATFSSSASAASQSRRGPQAAPLTEDERGAAIEFLNRRPVHNVIMSGWLMEHGVVSPQHRGTFYRTVDGRGNIDGIALIGRHTIFETASDKAIVSFADEARGRSDIRMVFGETDRLNDFWFRFRNRATKRGASRSELLFELRDVPAVGPTMKVERANLSHLDKVVAAHAAMVRDETGTDPMTEDPSGFLARCRDRIRNGKTWIALSPDREIAFKTEIVSRTPKAVYIEGVWVAPEHRGRGIGGGCLRSLCRELLDGTNAICGFVESTDRRAVAMYRKAGFRFTQRYRKIYV